MSTLVLLIATTAVCQTGQSQAAGSKCGSYCIYVALCALDLVSEPYSTFEKSLPAIGPDGYSFNDLEQIAQRFGADTLALEADLETLARLKGRRACIALLNQHFVVVKDIDRSAGVVSIIDPPAQYDRPFREFRRTYSRRALVVALAPIGVPSDGAAWRIALWLVCGAAGAIGLLTAARSLTRRRELARAAALILALGIAGCRRAETSVDGDGAEADAPPNTESSARALTDLRVEPWQNHAGKVLATSADHSVSMSTQLINDSSEPIRVTELRKSCTCTSVSLTSSTIPPHGRVTLHASFTLGNMPGPQSVAIHVLTSPAGNGPKLITFDWDLVTPLHAVPDRCQFGRLDLGARASARLELWNRGVALCPKCQVRIEGDRGLMTEKIEVDPSLSRAETHASESVSLQDDRRLGTIFLDLQPQSEPGDFTRLLDVTVQCGQVLRSRLIVPVAFTYRPRRAPSGAALAGSGLPKRAPDGAV